VVAAFLVCFASFLLQAIVQVLFLFPYALRRGLVPGTPDFARSIAEMALNDPTAILLQVLSLLPAHLLTFALIWALVTRFGKLPFFATIGWGWPRRLGFWRSVIFGVVLFVVATAVTKLLGSDKATPLEQIINSSTAARYALAFLAVFTAPFVEEFIFRGVLYAALQRLVGAVWAGLFVLVLFTLIHVPQYRTNYGVIAAVLLLSTSLTVVRAVTGRLLPCIVIHLVFNGISAIILLVEPHFSNSAPVPTPTGALLFLLTYLGLN
jgi:membrane protease YdiL (CAAX protease family)